MKSTDKVMKAKMKEFREKFGTKETKPKTLVHQELSEICGRKIIGGIINKIKYTPADSPKVIKWIKSALSTAQESARGEKKMSAWAVIWTNKAAKFYGVKTQEKLVTSEPREEVIVFRNKKEFYYADSVAVFYGKREANAFRGNNPDWICVPCKIIYSNKLSHLTKLSKEKKI